MSSTTDTQYYDQAKSAYRPDVDGLRALAILPVLLFHVGIKGFTGGFVGVDVFFVISGYLITGILSRELKAGHYSIAKFYQMRILRIFPALFVMLAGVAAVACFVLLPDELTRFGQSVMASVGFVSNIYFYLASGYFAPSSKTLPLLHTWSLAVEEQFYLFWPLLLALVYRVAPRKVLWVTIALAVASLVASIIWVRQDPTGAFYLIPTRTWELMIGALLALAPANLLRTRLLAEIAGAIGLLMILYCVARYNNDTVFPAEGALLPCLGAGLIIASGATYNTWVARGLSLPPIVLIGKISFSLYLWHWPVIVFTDIWLLAQDSMLVKVGVIVVSIVLGYLSWRFVEAPFRTPQARSAAAKFIFGPALGVMAVIAAIGLAVFSLKGFPDRLSPELRTLAAYQAYDGDAHYRRGQCFVVSADVPYDADFCLKMRPGHKHVLLVGDSHAAHLWPGLAAQAPDMDILQATQIGCRPAFPVTPKKGDKPCQTFFRKMLLDWPGKTKVDAIIIAGRWHHQDLGGLKAELEALPKGTPVIVVGPIQQYVTSLPRLLVRSESDHDPSVLVRGRMDEPFEVDKELRGILASVPGISYVSVVDTLCPDRHCVTMAKPGVPLQFDYGHFTVEGSELFAPRLITEINKVTAAK